MILNTKHATRNAKHIRGFTLIELLIVIAIIGALASISVFALQGARESARDSKRKSDLESIRSALEIYKADCNEYPAGLPSGALTDSGCSSPLGNVYMEDVPEDPTTSSGYCYNQISSVRYELCAQLEEEPASPASCSGCDSGGPVGNYRVTNP